MLQQTLESPFKNTVSAMSSAAQDRLWISQTLSGDMRTYAHLIDKYKDMLFGLICRVLKDRSQAEDILQDTFLQAYQKLNIFRHESKFSTWIYTIALNNLRNRLRRDKVIRWCSLDAGRRGRNDMDFPEIPHQESSIPSTIERKMDIEAIQRIAATFPIHYQAIFIMHYLQNLSLQEIADRMGRPLGTIKVYLHRSRKMLHKELKKSEAEPFLTTVSEMN